MGFEAIYIQNQRYNYYESYKTYEEALKIAKYKKKKTKTKYFIQKVEEGFWFPSKKYRLYFNKIMRLTWT